MDLLTTSQSIERGRVECLQGLFCVVMFSMSAALPLQPPFSTVGYVSTLFRTPYVVAVVVDASGSIYYTAWDTCSVYSIPGGATGRNVGSAVLMAGRGTASGCGFQDAAVGTNAKLNNPHGIVLDGASRVAFFCDAANNRIRRLDLSNSSVTTVAGDGTQSYRNGVGVQAQFGHPLGITYFNHID
ncbi:Hypothetical protein, putative, partial [Bodo saltans]